MVLYKDDNKKRFKYSVIMPCYNSESYIHSAIQSVVSQTYPNWELIAINDGSTDATLQILSTYAEEDSRIRIFSKQNGGYVSAVNMGLEKITGDYFLMMGSDDRISVNLFEELNIFSQNKAADCIAFRTLKVQDNSIVGYDNITDFSDTIFSSNTSFYDFTESHPNESAIFSCRDTSKCYKSKILGDLKYFGKYGMDADGIFSMLLCHKASSFMCLPVDGYFWTLRGDSLSGRKTFYEQECDRISNWIQFYECLYEMNVQNITYKERGYLYIFAEILAEFWENSGVSLSAYQLVQTASKTIKKTAKKHRIDLLEFLSGGYYLMVNSPVVWKLYMDLPKDIRLKLKRKGS